MANFFETDEADIGINPDPCGNPEWIGGAIGFTSEGQAIIPTPAFEQWIRQQSPLPKVARANWQRLVRNIIHWNNGANLNWAAMGAQPLATVNGSYCSLYNDGTSAFSTTSGSYVAVDWSTGSPAGQTGPANDSSASVTNDTLTAGTAGVYEVYWMMNVLASATGEQVDVVVEHSNGPTDLAESRFVWHAATAADNVSGAGQAICRVSMAADETLKLKWKRLNSTATINSYYTKFGMKLIEAS